MKEYKDISDQVYTLKSKQTNTSYTKLRMEKMRDILDKKALTPDMITQPLLQSLIQNVIIVDKQNIVIVLSDSFIHTNKEVSERSNELIEKHQSAKAQYTLIDHLYQRLCIIKLSWFKQKGHKSSLFWGDVAFSFQIVIVIKFVVIPAMPVFVNTFVVTRIIIHTSLWSYSHPALLQVLLKLFSGRWIANHYYMVVFNITF